MPWGRREAEGSKALLSALAVSALSSPRPDEDREYKIPDVNTGRRSQYYVLHEDGTFKYGYDTGEGAYEAAKQKTPGRQHGKFGYRDPDGNNVRLVYKAGEGGFQPTGTHIPVPSQEFLAAHAEASARPPFQDPLAQTNTDASYGFQFAGEGLSRTEQSDTDGNVRGSYSYVDEQGRTRQYTYTAGRGVGFVVEGSDLPVGVSTSDTPAATSLTSGLGAAAAAAAAAQYHGSTAATFRGAAAGTSHSTGSTSSSFGTTTTFGSHRTGFRRPAVTSTGTSAFRSSAATGTTGATAAHRTPTTTQYQQTKKYTGELANTRTTHGADGSRSFAYETSSQARSEAEDSRDNVLGSFDFVSEDDGQRRGIRYEASSDTGFIAEGAHIPVGPAVPGAPSGQPTGRIVPVQEVQFVDPLADTGTDASYGFSFDSEQYSRSETADADGNVQGTYTVVDDDGTRRTYRFRAGKGIGFETEVVSTSQGPRPSRPAASSTGSTSFTSTSTTTSSHGAAAPSPVVSYTSPGSGRFSTSYRTGTSGTAGTSFRAGTSAKRARRKGTSNLSNLSETPDTSPRPFQGLTSGTCHQVYPTDSGDY
ncbi:Larval cuticle protein LCP-17 [Portunus trituberculatus]|uniref:Larval cuticle protein LCP-17 n=1 Tax=Portunus trituberculatus TaxID=210409 RepID=A0A5B7DUV2_PORTR|nr:Larval cuticle protein LCP-17 [Portunus trituberculatus]